MTMKPTKTTIKPIAAQTIKTPAVSACIRDQILAKDGLVLGAVKVWALYELGERAQAEAQKKAAWEKFDRSRSTRQNGRSVRPYRKG